MSWLKVGQRDESNNRIYFGDRSTRDFIMCYWITFSLSYKANIMNDQIIASFCTGLACGCMIAFFAVSLVGWKYQKIVDGLITMYRRKGDE